jgi:2-polyprenyl-3-methyl-5-hydroxy-6-metoxy-1,4-benzoquinol methylase
MISILQTMSERDTQPEIMDQPGLEIVRHQRALRALSRINWISRSDAILWNPIRRLAEANRGQTIRVLDVATGGGDVMIRLNSRARRIGLPITFAGIDVSPTAIEFARGQARRNNSDVTFYPLDVLDAPLPTDFDVITSSLFLHHLPIDQAEELLRRMARAARSLVLINDLIRSRFGYLLAYLGTRFLTMSPIVHHDGMQSVRAAFTIPEAKQLATRAGLTDASFSWHWPFRFRLEWRRPEEVRTRS